MLGFGDISEHEQIKEHFRNAVQTEKVSHVYILSGEAGMGKKSLANALALSLLCEKGTAKSYMQCHVRRQVLSGNHLDLICVAHEKPVNIGVDDIREQISDTTQIRPYSSCYKIYIADEAEGMAVQAQNVLLKTIEEPSAYAITLLLTINQDVFLPTILSRCVQFKLEPLKNSVVKEYPVQSLGENESRADVYAALIRDNLGKAIHLAQSEEFGVMYRKVPHLLKHVKDTDISRPLDYIRKAKEENLDIREYLDFMQIWYRGILTYKATKDISLLVFKNEFSTIKSISTTSGHDGLEKTLEAIGKARIRLDANVDAELVMELVLLIMEESQNMSGL